MTKYNPTTIAEYTGKDTIRFPYSKPPYRPIDCALHDRLEAHATVGRIVRIIARGAHGEVREIEDQLVDVFTRGRDEFVRTAGGELIRLDRLESVDGVAFRPSAGASS